MEIWKKIKGFEDYEVSNLGNVKRISNFKFCNKNYLDNYFLKQKDNGKGYFRVKLSNNGVVKMYMVHRLIAENFIENPNNYKVVNHIDHNKKNNNIENLEWCTHSHNVNEFNKYLPLIGTKTRKTKGYTFSKKDKLYISRIGFGSKTITLSYFKNKENSIDCYNIAYDLKIKYFKNNCFDFEKYKNELKELIAIYKQKIKELKNV